MSTPNTAKRRGYEQGCRDRQAGTFLRANPHHRARVRTRDWDKNVAWTEGWCIGWKGGTLRSRTRPTTNSDTQPPVAPNCGTQAFIIMIAAFVAFLVILAALIFDPF